MAITNASRLASYVGAAITADGASGIVTAQSFHGDGANLTNVGVDTAQLSTSGLVVSGISTLAGATLSGVTTFTENVVFGATGAHLEFSGSSYSGSAPYIEFWVGNSGGTRYAQLDGTNAGSFQIHNTGHPNGEIDIRAKSTVSVQLNSYYGILAQASGGVKLYYPDSEGDLSSQKFETDAGGVKITGVCTATSFSGSGSGLTGLNIPAGFNELDAALFN